MKRRDFVKSTAATGAGLIILPSGTVKGMSAEDRRVVDGAIEYMTRFNRIVRRATTWPLEDGAQETP